MIDIYSILDKLSAIEGYDFFIRFEIGDVKDLILRIGFARKGHGPNFIQIVFLKTQIKLTNNGQLFEDLILAQIKSSVDNDRQLHTKPSS